MSGELAAAERGTRDALARLRVLGAGSAPVAAVNLALILVLRGRYDEARAIARPLLEEIERAGRNLLLPVVHACLLACAARARDGRDWDAHMAVLETRVTEVGYADPDAAVLLEQAVAAAADAGWAARAARARSVLAPLSRALGHDHVVAPGGLPRRRSTRARSRAA